MREGSVLVGPQGVLLGYMLDGWMDEWMNGGVSTQTLNSDGWGCVTHAACGVGGSLCLAFLPALPLISHTDRTASLCHARCLVPRCSLTLWDWKGMSRVVRTTDLEVMWSWFLYLISSVPSASFIPQCHSLLIRKMRVTVPVSRAVGRIKWVMSKVWNSVNIWHNGDFCVPGYWFSDDVDDVF